MPSKILVINCGSSSIKSQLFESAGEQNLARGLVSRIGEKQPHFTQETAAGKLEQDCQAADHEQAFDVLTEHLLDPQAGLLRSTADVVAVGHRVVHGGEDFVSSTLITDQVIAGIEKYVPLAPLHNPPNLVGIRAAQHHFPESMHVAVFDTAFHQTIPPEAFLYGLPYELYEKYRLRKYGFHGTSHRFVSQRAAELIGKPLEELKLVTNHLGNGSSITAVDRGKSVDTSMGMTPLEGVVMGTRTGDVDAGAVLFLAQKENLSWQQLDDLMNRRGGLLGISGISNDLRTIEKAAAEGHYRAQLAVKIFANRVRRFMGAYVVILGGADAIVFTGGIGENAVAMRARICAGLERLGIILDPQRNEACHAQEMFISTDDSPIKLLVVPTNEELLIMRDTLQVAEAALAHAP